MLGTREHSYVQQIQNSVADIEIDENCIVIVERRLDGIPVAADSGAAGTDGTAVAG